VASQFHPELKSRPTKAHPLFREFISASVTYHLNRENAKDTSNSNNPSARETVR